MKKISEVCEFLGITRRTLQEYDRIGLLSPTCRNESNHWLYDDIAILNLMTIQVFVEAGYPRKEIISIMKITNRDELNKRLDEAIIKIEDDKKRMDNLIEKLKFARNADEEFSQIIYSYIVRKGIDDGFIHSFQIENETETEGEINWDDPEDCATMDLMMTLISVELLRREGAGVSSKKVQTLIRKAINSLSNFLEENIWDCPIEEKREAAECIIDLGESINAEFEEKTNDKPPEWMKSVDWSFISEAVFICLTQ